MSTFGHLDVLSLPVSRQFEKVVLSNEVILHFEHCRGNCHVVSKLDLNSRLTSLRNTEIKLFRQCPVRQFATFV